MKAQSAMEYLMTYGWAILIIAVVLGALFQMGVFNSSTFAPKATPGSCQVIRPDGPGNINFISLRGTCINQLPQFVLETDGSGHVNIANSRTLSLDGNSFTVMGWVYASHFDPTYWNFPFASWDGNTNWIIDIGAYNGGMPYIEIANDSNLHFAVHSVTALSPDTWYYFAVTLNGNEADYYINGVKVAALANFAGTLLPFSSGSCQYSIGSKSCNGAFSWNGLISNIQLYNASLSANEITASYQEGIGGAPINLYHLIGWWPLNGNAKDYSGNSNDGAATNIKYISTWAQYYTPP